MIHTRRSYAKALFALDLERKQTEQTLRDFETLATFLKENPRLNRFLKIPYIKYSDKKTFLQNTFQGVFDPNFLHFLFYLVQTKRFAQFGSIASEYRLLVDQYFGIGSVELITAFEMDLESEKKMKEKLEKELHKQVQLIKKCNPQLIGGVLLIMGNTMLDASISGRMKKLQDRLGDNGIQT